MSLSPFQLLYKLAEFYKAWYKHYAIEGSPNIMFGMMEKMWRQIVLSLKGFLLVVLGISANPVALHAVLASHDMFCLRI
jgi:hypothetical protein